MARTFSSSKSESVTLRIPDEIFAQIKAHAKTKTRGNTSQAIVQLLEAGLETINSQPLTLEDSVLQRLEALESRFEEVLGE